VANPSFPAVTESNNVRLKSYIMAPISEPKLTNPEEVQEAIGGFTVGKTSGPNLIPDRFLKNLPQRAVSLLVLILTPSSSPLTSLQREITPE
jgi:hypothetical protein